MRAVLQPGKEYDFLTPQEMHKGLNDMQGRLVDALVREELRGIRPVKLTGVFNPNVTSYIAAPNAGYYWSILNLSVSNIQAGSNFGSIEFFVFPKGGTPSFSTSEAVLKISATTVTAFGKGQFLVDQDSAIGAVNTDTTNPLSYRIWLVEVPAEMVGKLYI